MGKLIKNHLARLFTLTAATCILEPHPLLPCRFPSCYVHRLTRPFSSPLDHLYTSILSFFWPKLLFDFLTTTLNPLVKPIPYLQIANTVISLLLLAFEYPLPFIFTNNVLKTWHARIETRLVVTLPLAMWTSVLGYQTYGAAIGYFCAWVVWWMGFVEGEVSERLIWWC